MAAQTYKTDGGSTRVRCTFLLPGGVEAVTNSDSDELWFLDVEDGSTVAFCNTTNRGLVLFSEFSKRDFSRETWTAIKDLAEFKATNPIRLEDKRKPRLKDSLKNRPYDGAYIHRIEETRLTTGFYDVVFEKRGTRTFGYGKKDKTEYEDEIWFEDVHGSVWAFCNAFTKQAVFFTEYAEKPLTDAQREKIKEACVNVCGREPEYISADEATSKRDTIKAPKGSLDGPLK